MFSHSPTASVIKLLNPATDNVSHGVFHSRLKTFLFSKSLDPSIAICPFLRPIS